MKCSKKLVQILVYTNWSQDKLADLLDVSNNTLNSWVKGKTVPRDSHSELIDEIYCEIVVPYICEIEEVTDKVEKRILKRKIKKVSDDNTCKTE